MNLRNTIIAAALALAVVTLILRFVASAHNDSACLGPPPCVKPGGEIVDWARAFPEATETTRPSVLESAHSGQSEDSAGPATAWAYSDLEQSIARDGSINMLDFLHDLDDAAFDDLVAELRRQQSPIGSERRSEFEAIVYSHPSSLDGSVSLDVIECGSRICVADLRSADRETLDSLVRDVTDSDSFVGQVVVGLPGSEVYSHGESRRLVFSHAADVTGVIIPAEDSPESAGESGEN